VSEKDRIVRRRKKYSRDKTKVYYKI